MIKPFRSVRPRYGGRSCQELGGGTAARETGRLSPPHPRWRRWRASRRPHSPKTRPSRCHPRPRDGRCRCRSGRKARRPAPRRWREGVSWAGRVAGECGGVMAGTPQAVRRPVDVSRPERMECWAMTSDRWLSESLSKKAKLHLGATSRKSPTT